MKQIVCAECNDIIQKGENMVVINWKPYCYICFTEFKKVDDEDIETYGVETDPYQPDAMDLAKELM